MSLAVQVYQQLRSDIHELVFAGNEFLNEDALAHRYNVSKAPIRDALRKLCMEGVLISYPRKGYLIASISKQELLHAQRLRQLVEGYAIDQALLCDAQEGKRALLELAQAPYSIEGNSRFHIQLAALADSRIVMDMVQRLLSTVERPLSLQNMAVHVSGIRNEHIRLAEALLAGDAREAKQALSDDVSS